jgi:hypothetical protein
MAVSLTKTRCAFGLRSSYHFFLLPAIKTNMSANQTWIKGRLSSTPKVMKKRVLGRRRSMEEWREEGESSERGKGMGKMKVQSKSRIKKREMQEHFNQIKHLRRRIAEIGSVRFR